MQEFDTRIPFSKVRNFKEIYSASLLFLKQHWKIYLGLVLLYAGPFFVFEGYYASKNIQQNAEANTIIINKISYLQLLFEIVSTVLLNTISFSIILVYKEGKELTRENIASTFNQNFLTLLGATFFSQILLSIGFSFMYVPGIILLVPLELFIYDRILLKGKFGDSIRRSFFLTRTDLKLSYGVVLVVYVLFLGVIQIFSGFLNLASPDFIVTNTISMSTLSIISSIINIPVVFLYHSLNERAKQKIYENL